MRRLSVNRRAAGALCALLLLSCTGCALFTPDPRVRVELQSEFGGPLYARIFLEGSDGMAIDAARVSVRTPTGALALAGYDTSEGCYTVTVSAPASGSYEITANSNALDAEYKLTVAHTPLASRPNVNNLTDASGNDALAAQALASDSEILVAAPGVTDAVVYTISITSGTQTIYETSSATASFVIPPESLEPGSYSVRVTAQFLVGDPEFGTADYYSASSATGASLSFEVQ